MCTNQVGHLFLCFFKDATKHTRQNVCPQAIEIGSQTTDMQIGHSRNCSNLAICSESNCILGNVDTNYLFTFVLVLKFR